MVIIGTSEWLCHKIQTEPSIEGKRIKIYVAIWCDVCTFYNLMTFMKREHGRKKNHCSVHL